jgi:lipopolysaccharide transport system permease protein
VTAVRPAAAEIHVIRARRGRAALDLASLWSYRELIYFFVWRDIKVRYRQTLLGGVWAILQPVVTMVIFSVVFGRLAGISSDGLPYPLFALTALLPWTLFATGVSQAANSLVGNQNLLKKVYFPRLALPIGAVVIGLVDLAVASLVLGAMMIAYDVQLSLTVLFVVPLILLALITALGVGLLFAALNVRYRDIRYIVPFVLQAWLFLTPVAYPSSLIDQPWRTLYAINPTVGVVEGMRWAVLGADTAPGPLVAVSTAVALLILVGGLSYFRQVEGTFADVV